MGERYTHREESAVWRTSCGRFYVVSGQDPSEKSVIAWHLRPGVPASSLGELVESGIFSPETFFPTRAAAMRALREMCRSAGVDPPTNLKTRRSSQWQTVDGTIDVARRSGAPRTWEARLVRIDGLDGDAPTYESEAGFPTRAAATEWARERQASGTPGRYRNRTEIAMRAFQRCVRDAE